MNFLIIISILISSTHGQLYPPYGFFSTLDLTSVTWALGVNSQKALNETLANPSIKMIEADACKGRERINGSETPFDIAIMAEPPNVISDLSFSRFLDIVVEYNKGKPVDQRKGIRLDFKDYFGAASAVRMMRRRNTTSNGTDLQFPVWLNAEVVRGSEESNSKEENNMITVGQMIKLHNVSLPNAVLSLWWPKTGNITAISSYPRENFEDMVSAIQAEIPDPLEMEILPITFNLRAGLAANSLGNVMYLLNATSFRSTVTLYSETDDPKPNYVKWDDFIKVVGKDRTFVDVPFELKDNSAGNLGFNFVFVAFSCSLRYFLCSLWN